MRSRHLVWPVLVAAIGFGLAFGLGTDTAQATEFTTTVNIDAAQAESANPGASGTGTGTVTFNNQTNLLSWNLSWSGTQQPVNAAHFHGPAAPGVGAGIQVTITDITSPSVGSATISAAQAQMLMDDLMYVNFHTAHSPAGEIRGQVVMSGVGGVAELPDGSASPLQTGDGAGVNGTLIAALAAAALVGALGAGGLGWAVARRR